jgi:hypothetical protein
LPKTRGYVETASPKRRRRLPEPKRRRRLPEPKRRRRLPEISTLEKSAVRIMRKLYEATGGKPQRWESLDDLGAVNA